MTSQWASSSWKPGMFHESRQRRSYRDPSWRPRIQSDTESGLNSEGRWRDYSWLSSDNESEKWSWRQREISKVSRVTRATDKDAADGFNGHRWPAAATPEGKTASRPRFSQAVSTSNHQAEFLKAVVRTSLLQYSRAVPLWLPVAHLVNLITWSNCLIRELTSSCCFFKFELWSFVRVLQQTSAWVYVHSQHLILVAVIHTSKWFSRILPFLLISIIKLQMDFFISFVTDFRFSSTCWSLKEVPAEHNLNFPNCPRWTHQQHQFSN